MQQKQTSVSLKAMVETGLGKFIPPGAPSNQVLIQVASFLHRELPIRFAHRVKELESLPYGLSDTPSIQKLIDGYVESLDDVIRENAPETDDEERKFKIKMRKIYSRHADTLITIAKGLYEFKNSDEMRVAIEEMNQRKKKEASVRGRYRQKTGFGYGYGAERSESMESEDLGIGDQLADFKDIHRGIDTFLMHRIGIRVIIGQYLAIDPGPTSRFMQFRHLTDNNRRGSSMSSLTEPSSEVSDVGLICTRTRPAEIATAAAEDAADIFERQLPDFDAPKVEIIGNISCTMAYIPSHLYYIMFELLKNSMRATAEFHGDDEPLPPVKIVIGSGNESEDVVIKYAFSLSLSHFQAHSNSTTFIFSINRISDLGGGIPRSHNKRIFNYLFTTAAPAFQNQLIEDMESFGRSSPLAGLGYGLPIARLYARYFGGDLDIMSVEGHGTDAYLHLNRLGDNQEPLSY